VTVEDGSGAVLVRLPEATSVRIGDKLLIAGEMGTYYGAPQLAASDAPLAVTGGKQISPAALRSAPIATKLEWRLVSVTGAVTAVTKDGDSWHAELAVGDGSIPIDGIARSGIPSTALAVDRIATVVGIVKRAFPTASDQRLAVVPRSASDIALGGSAPKGNGAATGQSIASKPNSAPDGGTSQDIHLGNSITAESAPNAIPHPLVIAIADIASHENQSVTVGGRVDAIDGNRLLVNDDTSLVAVRVPSTAGLGLLRIGALVNARGQVTRTEQGGLEVVVGTFDAIRIVDAQTALASPSAAINDGKLQPSTAGQQLVVQASPASSTLPLLIAGLLLVATAVAVAGALVARRPDLVRSAIRGLAAARARK
jgi:hypothetical protein